MDIMVHKKRAHLIMRLASWDSKSGVYSLSSLWIRCAPVVADEAIGVKLFCNFPFVNQF